MTVFGPNALFGVGAQLSSVRLDPFLSFNFLVELEGLIVGGFTEVSGLQIETEVQEYREGGLNGFVHKLAGPTRYPTNLTLRHGLTGVDGLWAWHQAVASGDVVRKNGTIYLLGRDRLPVTWWNFVGAYPVRWTGPDLRAEGNSVAVESVELVHQGIVKPAEASILAAARGMTGA